MGGRANGTTNRRVVGLAILAGILLTGPVLSGVLGLGDSLERYERTQVIATENGGIELTASEEVPPTLDLSDGIACTGGGARICALERYVADGPTVPAPVLSTGKDFLSPCSFQRYCYALVEGQVYQTTYVPNGTTTEDGYYRFNLGLDPVDPREALDAVSLPPTDPEVPSAIATAAKTGAGHARHELEVPETTIEVDSGEFYRVYHDGTIRPSTVELLAAMLLTYFAPVFGLGLLFRLSVTYRVRIEPR